jgi:hypothetical protein
MAHASNPPPAPRTERTPEAIDAALATFGRHNFGVLLQRLSGHLKDAPEACLG